jgi:ABC-2 type transport system permease protein
VTAIRYEMARLRTVRATWGAGLAVVAVGAAVTWVAARDLGAVPVRAGDAAQVITSGAAGPATPLAAMAVVFAAALACRREQRTASLQTLLLALPRRTRTLAAKTVVTAGFAGLAALVGLAVNALVAAAVFGPGFRALVWDQVPAPRVLGGYVVFLVLASVLGTAVGVLTRGSATAAVLVAALPLVVEPLIARAAELAPAGRYQEWIAYLPFNAAERMLATGGPGLSPGTGALTFACWAGGVWVVAALVFARREAA